MKTNNLIPCLVFAVVITLAATGCHKQATSLKPIPGTEGPKITEPTSPPINPEPPVVSQDTNSIPLAPRGDGEYNEDATTLAAEAVHFHFDSSTVRKDEMVHVEAAVAALRLDPNEKVRVEGNCDERGTEEYNRSLGERRALAVREAMVKLGIEPARILTLSYGEDRPVDPGHDEEAWKKNRRAEFILLHPK